jgi:hypothetical protein
VFKHATAASVGKTDSKILKDGTISTPECFVVISRHGSHSICLYVNPKLYGLGDMLVLRKLTCHRPVYKSSDKGALAKHLLSEQSIIHRGTSAPEPLPHEARGDKRHALLPPIRIKPTSKATKIDPRLRLLYSEIFRVKHNSKVSDIGMIHHTSVAELNHQFFTVNRKWLNSSAVQAADGDYDAQSYPGNPM